jgi:hypothetical protein
VKAVPLLSNGSRNSARPRGESEIREFGVARAGAIMSFPLFSF